MIIDTDALRALARNAITKDHKGDEIAIRKSMETLESIEYLYDILVGKD
jgi:hypothetical protein